MAKVSLRIYNREIETMVDRGQLDEAIAHCRHILNAFPKNLDTYRLLGKAYLEAKRYDEATDVFERLLTAVPDDFVAHVGMSIVRDERNEMDAAIWHMQRAFEVQPSNAAIQGELQRLFGRRDGVEPPKVRLTRGALAHMYVQGELYPQAISEIKAVLEEDRERQDMQVLLARANYHAGQKNEAAEICSQLLRRYPYCFDANRVLVELLPETERGESTQVYRRRVNELDPYATFTTGSIFHTEEVPDAAVSLERLDWNGEPVDLGQEWRDSLGLGLADQTTAGGEEPDWLTAEYTTGTFNVAMPTEEPASASGSDDEIPEFLRDAGWGKDTGTYKEGSGPFEASDESLEEPELAEGDLPDWIKAMAPTGAGVASSTPQAEPEEDLSQDDVPDWLQGLGNVQASSSEEQPLDEGDLPDWIAAMKPVGEAPQAQEPEQGLMAGSAGDEDLPDWMAALKPAEETSQVSQPEQEMMAEPAGDEDLPAWIAAMKPASDAQEPEQELMAESAGDEDLPDWLQSIQREQEKLAPQDMSGETSQEPVQEFPEMSSESLSDWKIGDEETAGAVDFDATDTGALGTSAAEQDDAIAWLEGLAAKHGAKPEELVTRPEERTETEPEWIQQARAAKEQESAEIPAAQEETPAEPSEDLPDFLAKMQVEPTEAPGVGVVPVDSGAPGPSAQEQDDAIAWLESLAAKHGARPEELVTDPNARKETAPEWVQKSAEAGSAAQPPAEETAPAEEPFESVPEWIEPAKEDAGSLFAELEDAQPQEPLSPAAMDETGMWLRDLSEEAETISEQEPATEAEAPAMSMDEDVPEWLRGMETESSQAEAAPLFKEEEQAPDWLDKVGAEPSIVEAGSLSEGEEIPDWLSEMKAEASVPEAGPVSAGEPPEVPDWLLGVENDPTATEQFPVFPPEEETTFEPGQEAAGKIDINSASVEQLAELPGIGEFLAQNIVAYREIYGPYSSIDDLSNIVGIDQPMIEDLRSRVEVHPGEPEIADWLQSIEAEEIGTKVEETVAEEAVSDDFPSWLAGLDEEPVKPEVVVSADDDLPEWLRTVDEQEPVQSEPTASTDWQPVDISSTFPEEPLMPAGEPETVAEEPPVQAAPSAARAPEPEPQPVEPKREPYVEPVTRSRTGMTGILSTAQDPALTQAQMELTHGNISSALQNYEKLIRKGKMLDEIIFDLREALYRYPVDVSILQALGDAYMRSNRLQDALDSYTKAEELLR